MRRFEKIVEALDIKLGRAYLLEAQHPFVFCGAINERNVLVQLNNGVMMDRNGTTIKPNDFYFIPQSHQINLKIGKANAIEVHDELLTDETVRDHYLRQISSLKYSVTKKEILTIVSFEVLLYNAFPFFPLLDIPIFNFSNNEECSWLVKNLCMEWELDNLGKQMMLKNYILELVIRLCRHIYNDPHLRQFTQKLDYLRDKRLVDVVDYIHDNLNADLSNKRIASIAFVSEDYIGQFFKTLTNRNLQDYIEDQRLAKALQMLKSNPESVQEISSRVGFKDPAYFSRRFKMKFGINANAIKQGKSEIV